MRSAFGSAVLVAFAACYSPTAPQNAPCDPSTNLCPAPQTCQLSAGEYVCTTMPIDAQPIDTPMLPPDVAIDAALTPIAMVQSTAGRSTAATNAIAFTADVAQHDAIIVCFTIPSGTATLTSIADRLDNTYTVVVGPIVSNSFAHYIAFAPNSPAGADTVTVTLSAVVNNWEVLTLEYSGLALISPFDVSASDSGNGTAMSSGDVTTTHAHELLLAYAHSVDPAPGTGFTSRDAAGEDLVEDQVVDATGTYGATGVTSSGIWTLLLATFAGQ